MKKILIIGANGYIGARLSLLLSENNHIVTAHCFPNIPTNERWTNAMDKIVVGDLRDKAFIESLTNENYDIVIHLVSLDHNQSNSTPDFVASINVLPTWNLLNAFSKKGTLGKFIYFSTFQVYGEVPLGELTEEFSPLPQNIYGLTHLLSENICNYYNLTTNINCINVRLSNSYGSPVLKENNCWGLVINDLCKKAVEEKKIILLSDGSPQRDFIHSSDVYWAIEILINNHKKNIENNTYHVSSGNTFSILELAHVVKEVYQEFFGKDIKVILHDNSISENPNKYIETERYIVDNSKIESLGYRSKTNLKDGISEIFNYLNNNE